MPVLWGVGLFALCRRRPRPVCFCFCSAFAFALLCFALLCFACLLCLPGCQLRKVGSFYYPSFGPSRDSSPHALSNKGDEGRGHGHGHAGKRGGPRGLASAAAALSHFNICT
ncbi:hypothetical protein LX32DRAFT_62343 [Colletotrichum zoysiae]|uniref:Uncharacterized protein n=1 Tax=Colletotrichum zoysiae TaxID=1216348 RepID=A0AAD9HAD3_9PEZI|nr:hypothetical protein LX32DRAFT_62343 [Colletotrichum zoysiae]